jgi:hypothetical protein
VICRRGHKVVDSTGDHATLAELGPGLYGYQIGPCASLPPGRLAAPGEATEDAHVGPPAPASALRATNPAHLPLPPNRQPATGAESGGGGPSPAPRRR